MIVTKSLNSVHKINSRLNVWRDTSDKLSINKYTLIALTSYHLLPIFLFLADSVFHVKDLSTKKQNDYIIFHSEKIETE